MLYDALEPVIAPRSVGVMMSRRARKLAATLRAASAAIVVSRLRRLWSTATGKIEATIVSPIPRMPTAMRISVSENVRLSRLVRPTGDSLKPVHPPRLSESIIAARGGVNNGLCPKRCKKSAAGGGGPEGTAGGGPCGPRRGRTGPKWPQRDRQRGRGGA